jgi:hypothetical protein
LSETVAVRRLRALGAIIKPFAVRSIRFSGLVVRLDEDQRRGDGLVSAEAASSLKELCSSAAVLLELRGAQLSKHDVQRLLELERLAGLDIAGASGEQRLLSEMAVFRDLALVDLSLRPRGLGDLAEVLKLPGCLRLCLSRTGLDDAAIDGLGAMTGLKELFVDHHRASPAAIARLRAALPDCRIVA